MFSFFLASNNVSTILLLIGFSTPSLSEKVFCVGQTGNLYELNSCDNNFITLYVNNLITYSEKQIITCGKQNLKTDKNLKIYMGFCG